MKNEDIKFLLRSRGGFSVNIRTSLRELHKQFFEKFPELIGVCMPVIDVISSSSALRLFELEDTAEKLMKEISADRIAMGVCRCSNDFPFQGSKINRLIFNKGTKPENISVSGFFTVLGNELLSHGLILLGVPVQR